LWNLHRRGVSDELADYIHEARQRASQADEREAV